MSAASDGNETTQAVAAPATPQPHIQVLKGNPTDHDLAALISVLGCAGGRAAEPVHADRNLWGHPVDKLRYPLISWQRITLLQRTHMRR